MRYCNEVIFTDKNKFNIFASDEHCTIWVKKNEKLKPETYGL